MPAGWRPWPTTRWPSSSPRRPTSPASSTRRSSTARGCPGSYIEYLALLRDVFAECKRVLEPGGRIAVNVANLGRKPYRSLAADVMAILQDDLHLLPRGEIVWQKGEGASGSCAWGSFRSAANPVLRDVTERVIVASKGRFGRARSPKERRRDGPAPREQHRGGRLHGADARRLGHPARERGAGAAPRTLPRRAARSGSWSSTRIEAISWSTRSPGPAPRSWRRCAAGATPWATTSTPPTSSCPAPAWRPRRRSPGHGGRR